jgi:hypothetical protein
VELARIAESAAKMAVSGNLLGGSLRGVLKFEDAACHSVPGGSRSVNGVDKGRNNAAPPHDCAERIVGRCI